MKWMNKGHQYDALGEKICEQNKENMVYYIWGAGTFGISFYELFCNEINIKGFVDSDLKKQQTIICGLPIFAPESLENHCAYILVSAGWTKEIYTQLNELGYIKYQDYMHIDDFTSLYYWYKYKRVYISDITYVITERCSLKCQNCNSFMPLIHDPINISVEQVVKNFEQFFRYVDNVNVLGLVGGDSMMNPQFVEIVEEIGQRYYGKKASHIEVYSNAVIIPDQKAIEVMKKYDIFYRFSDYRPYTNEKQKIEEVICLLKKSGIRYDHVKFDKWCDCGYPQLSNGIIANTELINFFDSCDRKTCHGLYDGYVLNCGMAWSANRIDYCKLEPSDCFDISDYNEDRKIELIEYMLGYSEKGYLNYCKMCNGSFNINNHFIEAGEQMGEANAVN